MTKIDSLCSYANIYIYIHVSISVYLQAIERMSALWLLSVGFLPVPWLQNAGDFSGFDASSIQNSRKSLALQSFCMST